MIENLHGRESAHLSLINLGVQVRLPPMNLSKEATEPKMLATGLGNLFSMTCELVQR